jgi:hypothetical protein
VPDSEIVVPKLEKGLTGSDVTKKDNTPVAVLPEPKEEPKQESEEEPKHKPKVEPKPKVKKTHDYVRPSRRQIPDYSNLDEIETARRWTEFEVNFNKLKIHFPDDYKITMPDRDNESLPVVHARYNQYVENIYKEKFLGEEADKNRFFLVLFWAVIEIVLILIGINANGYTALQISLASQYDILLIELGEEKWNRSGGAVSSSPIYDMVVSSLITLGIFLFIKFVTSMLGDDASNSVSSYIIGEMVRNKKERGSSGSLVGVRDVLDLLTTLKANVGNGGGGFGMDNIMGMMGNLLGNINV